MRILKSSSFQLTLLLLVLATVYWIHYAPSLPTKIPTHFDGHGNADAWSSPRAFARLYWEVILGLFLVFTSLAFALQVIPRGLINLPRRDYWLSGELGGQTRLKLAENLLTFCAVTLIFFLLNFHQLVRAAIDQSNRLTGEFNWILGAYLSFVAVWTGSILWRYSRVPQSQ
jgi:uncharacterized membrane protein